jgi:hypothetical protein
VWAIVDFRSARQRDRASPHPNPPPAGKGAKTAITVVVGVVAWAVFAFWLHRAWIGVSPMGA